MKTVVIEEDGIKQAYVIKDNMPESEARAGIPLMQYDVLDDLPWNDIIIAIHNSLVDNELYDIKAIRAAQNLVSSVVKREVTRKIIQLAKQSEEKT